MTEYTRDVVALLGCTETDAMIIEYIMREEIFQSTLDWQTKAELNRAARNAAQLLAVDRATYEEFFVAKRAAFQQSKEEPERMICYEI